jgi:hypothetical protein
MSMPVAYFDVPGVDDRVGRFWTDQFHGETQAFLGTDDETDDNRYVDEVRGSSRNAVCVTTPTN